MRFLGIFSLVVGLNFAAFAQSADLCASLLDRDNFKPVKTVNPQKDKLTVLEKGMIQVAVLSNSSVLAYGPISPTKSLAVFNDTAYGRDGSLGGEILYYKISNGDKEDLAAVVTYYPGDNEYGAVFQVVEGNYAWVNLVGTISDSDLSCLRYAK